MRLFTSIILVAAFAFRSSASLALPVPLDLKAFKHVTFDGVPPTTYTNAPDGSLHMQVKESASFLLLPFDAPRRVAHVGLRWRSEGRLAVPDAAAEATKAGDDTRLRIGLLLAGDAPTVPFFAPAWIKAIRDYMKKPAARVLYLVADARHAPGERWTSPFSDSLELVSLASTPARDGWREASFEASPPLSVVGLWIMADGDGSHSTFTTDLSSLDLSD